MKMTAKFVAAGVTALALAGGVTAGIASADPTTPAPGPSATASPTPGQTAKPNKPAKKNQANKGDKKHGLLARALHGEATVGGKQTRVVAFQRGTVDQVSATEVTVKSKDGFTATYRIDAKTKVKKDKKAAAIADVKAADRVRIVATKDGSTLTAKTIGDHGTK
jgi:hypothetical protein